MANELPNYPKDHQVGVRVPKGGSDCARCNYLDGHNCRNDFFVKWHGSKRIPAPLDEYCCDFFEAKKKGAKNYFFDG